MTKARQFDHDAMLADREAGMTFQQIAVKHGCRSVATVHQALKGRIVILPADRVSPPKPALKRPDVESILTEAFRKVWGYCPVADGARE